MDKLFKPLTPKMIDEARTKFFEELAKTILKPTKHTPEYEGDSRDANGKTWRDREPLL